MADVGRTLGLGEQIGIIARLRWRIFRNSLSQRSAKLELLGLILSGLFGGLFVVGLAFAFGAGAYFFASTGRLSWMALLFWAVFVFWQVFPVFFTSFTMQFDFRSLLRFPLSLGAFFVVSLAYGLADPVALGAILWLLAMTIGAAAARPELFPAMLLIVAAFALLNAFLERLIGSWIERLLARRRTREIIFAVFILLMLSLQLTGIVVERYGKALASVVQRVLPLLTGLPAGLAGQALNSAGHGHSAGFLLNLAGVAAYASAFAFLLWRRLRAQYRGEELSESLAPVSKLKIPVAAKIQEEAAPLRLLPPTVAAMLIKEFRYLSRNGVLLLNLFLPPALILLFSYQMEFLGTKRPHPGRMPFSRDWFFPGAMAYVMLLLTGPAYNCFAYDGRGIQMLLTAPVRFRDVFLGKNLLLALVMALEAVAVGVLLTLRIGLPGLSLLVATLAAVVFATLGQLVVANWASVNYPRRLEFGTFRNQRASGMAVLIALGMQLLLIGTSSLIFSVGSWLSSPWLPVGVFALLAAAAAGGYAASLDPLSRLAERKREVLLEKLCR